MKMSGATKPTKQAPKVQKRKKAKTAVVPVAQDALTAAPKLIETDWVELFPSGISVGSGVGRPVLILKDKNGVEVLPVWIQAIDAGVALAELSHSTGATPHAVTRRLLEMLELKLESCVFTELIGHHQFVSLTFRGGGELVKTLRVRADEAMSFCIQGRARFYSTKDFMARCRALDEDLSSLEHNLAQGQLPGLQAELEISSKKHPYVM